jgi:NTE family protein
MDDSIPRTEAQTGQRSGKKLINLALQGGGAHGAFAWGVLDRLLDEEHIEIDGISATSAGAMNATVTGYGLAVGGREGAKEALAEFWRKISEAASKGPLQPSPLDKLFGNDSLENSPAFFFFDMITRMLSPYQFNPMNFNPLRDVLESTVDFEVLRRDCPVKLFLCATNVRTGKVKIFENHEITSSSVLASGCLPFLFQTVMIDGEPYWDGGYMGNPALFPLIYSCKSKDIVVVHINPLTRDEIPKTASEILNRLNEISFNSSLMREMRAVSFVTKLIDDGALHSNNIQKMLIHSIEAEHFMKNLGVTSKLNADWDFLMNLRHVGRKRAEMWLNTNFEKLGHESTVDIHATYL